MKALRKNRKTCGALLRIPIWEPLAYPTRLLNRSLLQHTKLLETFAAKRISKMAFTSDIGFAPL